MLLDYPATTAWRLSALNGSQINSQPSARQVGSYNIPSILISAALSLHFIPAD